MALPIETSQLICKTNQLPGFYMRGTLVVKGLNQVVPPPSKALNGFSFIETFRY